MKVSLSDTPGGRCMVMSEIRMRQSYEQMERTNEDQGPYMRKEEWDVKKKNYDRIWIEHVKMSDWWNDLCMQATEHWHKPLAFTRPRLHLGIFQSFYLGHSPTSHNLLEYVGRKDLTSDEVMFPSMFVILDIVCSSSCFGALWLGHCIRVLW